jgi:hypothetical protein
MPYWAARAKAEIGRRRPGAAGLGSLREALVTFEALHAGHDARVVRDLLRTREG